jgi:hypothetical protein
MKYSALHTYVSNIAATMGLSLLHDTEPKVNAYTGTFPLLLMYPPSAEIAIPGEVTTVDTYEMGFAFMQLLPPDHNPDIARAIVAAQWDEAKEFLMRMINGTETNPVKNARIQPFFYFPFSAKLTAGVVLLLTFETIDDFDWCIL